MRARHPSRRWAALVALVVLVGPLGARADAPTSGNLRVHWPERFSISFAAGFALGDWSSETFDEPIERRSLSGERLALAPGSSWGAQVTLGYTPMDLLRLELGLGYDTPDLGGTPVPTLGVNSRIERVHHSRWLVAISLRHRWRQVAPFAGAYLGVEQTLIDVTGPDALLRAYRVVAGPRVGMRAHLHDLIYLELSGTLNLVQPPDFTAQAALGVGSH